VIHPEKWYELVDELLSEKRWSDGEENHVLLMNEALPLEHLQGSLPFGAWQEQESRSLVLMLQKPGLKGRLV
jgi:hypothetical protein